MDLKTAAAWTSAGCRRKHETVNNFHGLKDPLFHCVLTRSSGWGDAGTGMETGGVGGRGGGGHLWIDENDSTESLHALFSVTYESL